jgi:hypothetical protein
MELEDFDDDAIEFDDDVEIDELEDWDELDAQQVMQDVVPQRDWR